MVLLRRAAAFVCLLTASFAAFAQDLTAEQKTAVLNGIKDVVENRAFVPGVDFSKWSEFITKRQEELDKATTVTAFGQVVNQALRDFGFSHIRLLSPRAAANRNRTSIITSGASVAASTEKGGLEVRSIRENSPAAEAGLKQGEVIVSVDGNPAKEPTQLEGDEGKKLALEVKGSDGATRQVSVELKRISTVRAETLTWLSDKVAVLKVFTFGAGYDRENIEKLVQEASGKAEVLAIDLRSNGGGAVNNLNHLLSLLMPDQTVYGTFVSKRVFEQYKEANKDKEPTLANIVEWAPNKTRTRLRPSTPPFSGRLSVFINRGSGSASEITAAALKENREAVVIGTRSAGAVLASVFRTLPEGFSLQYPVSDYVTVKGARLEGNPVQPDHEVTGRAEEGKDPVHQKLLEVLGIASPVKVDPKAA